MNYTPRTDEQINGKPCTRFEILAGDSLRNAAVPSEFARTLEPELNASNAEIEEKRKELEDRIKRLEEELMDSKNKHAVLIADVVLNEDRAEQIKRLREANFQLREGAEEQKQRIKRLEEAGDALASWTIPNGNSHVDWRKAKEAKP